MVTVYVPVELLRTFIGGDATADILQQLTSATILAKRAASGVFTFPLALPEAIRHTAEEIGIAPAIDESARLYLQTDANRTGLTYLVTVGDAHRYVIGVGQFSSVPKPTVFTDASELRLRYALDTSGVRLTRLQNGTHAAEAPLAVVPMNEEGLEALIRKHQPQRKEKQDEGTVNALKDVNAELRRAYDAEAQKNVSAQALIRGLEQQLAEATARLASHASKSEGSYPAEITSDKDRFLYGLAQSLMKRCIERGRYKENDMVGLGPDDGELRYRVWQGSFNFYKIAREELPIIATTNLGVSPNTMGTIRQTYYNASKNLAGLFPEFAMANIPAYAVLFLQLTSFGPGRAKSVDKIQAQLGFTQQQIGEAPEYELLLGTEKAIERTSLNETMKQVYPLFMQHRKELYRQCSAAQSL
ncbi:MAG: hypothetical protein Q7R76_01255 [Candidatus Woesearchaeota archaeon]|nr:hypothetical protein [Candidatus Woesearchaeota archaeon]